MLREKHSNNILLLVQDHYRQVLSSFLGVHNLYKCSYNVAAIFYRCSWLTGNVLITLCDKTLIQLIHFLKLRKCYFWNVAVQQNVSSTLWLIGTFGLVSVSVSNILLILWSKHHYSWCFVRTIKRHHFWIFTVKRWTSCF